MRLQILTIAFVVYGFFGCFALNSTSAQTSSFFSQAIHDNSTSPFMVSVLIAANDGPRVVCIPAKLLEQAEMVEHGYSDTNSKRAKIKAEICANVDRVYVFKTPKAMALLPSGLTATDAQRAEAELSQNGVLAPSQSGRVMSVADAFVLEQGGWLVRKSGQSGKLYAYSHSKGGLGATPSLIYAPQQTQSQEDARHLVQSLPGYSSISRRFDVNGAMLGQINGDPYSLTADLVFKSPPTAVSAIWGDPIVGGKPQYDWSVFGKSYRRANEAAGKQAWFTTWKKAGSDRYIVLIVFGDKPWADDGSYPTATQAWKKAGLIGVPAYQFEFNKGNDWVGTAYLDQSGETCLLRNGSPEIFDPSPPTNMVPTNPSETSRLHAEFRSVGKGYYIVGDTH